MGMLRSFIDRHGITMRVTETDRNPNMADEAWARTARHWKATLRRGQRTMTVPFSQGSAHTEPPEIADVLDALASDSSGLDNARSFEEWASEYGYDVDSRKAERIYNAVERQAKKLVAFLGPKLYQELLYETERE